MRVQGRRDAETKGSLRIFQKQFGAKEQVVIEKRINGSRTKRMQIGTFFVVRHNDIVRQRLN
jgi:hypothetical protein